MSRDQTIPAPSQITCQCGAMVNLVSFTGDITVRIPVDIDHDSGGDLVVVGSRAGYTIRPVRNGEVPEDRFRRHAHWDGCPHVERWREVKRSVGLGATGIRSDHDSSRIGPCARCGNRHPWRYGGPVASPVCDRCREAAGEPLMGEYL